MYSIGSWALIVLITMLFVLAVPVILIVRALAGRGGQREARGLRPAEARLAERLESQAARMERRMENVEEIVDIRKE